MSRRLWWGSERPSSKAGGSFSVSSWSSPVTVGIVSLRRPQTNDRATHLGRLALLRERDMEGGLPHRLRPCPSTLKRHPAPRPQNRQHLPHRHQPLRNRRHERVQSPSLTTARLHPNRHPLLCLSLNMERSTLWPKVRHLVFWLHFVRDGDRPPALRSWRYGQSVPEDQERKV